jgi:hypothetical protein
VTLRSRVLRALIAAIVATMLLIPTGVGAADPQTNVAERAIPLQPGKPLSGALPGAPAAGSALSNNGAGLAYYKFEYPGDNSLVTINLQVYPDDEALLADEKIGFVVYGPRSASNSTFTYAKSGAQPKKAPNVSGDFRSQDPGSYLVQIHNDAHAPINYSISADGLPAQPASAGLTPVGPTPAPAGAGSAGGAAAPQPAAPAPLPAAPTTGSAGATGRSVDLRSLVPPASVFGQGWSVKSTSTQGSNASVRVFAAEYVAGDQNSPSAAGIIGLDAAQNDAARDALIPAVRQSFEPQGYTFTASSDFGDRPGVRATSSNPPATGLMRAFQIRDLGVAIIVVVASDKAAEGERLLTALAQGEQTTINEALGIAGPAPQGGQSPGQTVTPGQTARLTGGAAPIKGTLGPGQFVLLQVDYPGDESVYTVNEQVDPDDPALLEKAGFQVFQPNGTLQVKGGAQPKLQPNVSADIIGKIPGSYTVKVFNDNPNAAISYSVTLATKAAAPK